jgi:hypothetical protein
MMAINFTGKENSLLYGLHPITATGSLLILNLILLSIFRCGNIAAILELDENLNKSFKKFNAAPEDFKGPPQKKPLPEYFL